MRVVAGWAAIVLVLFATVMSIGPGATSMIASVISMLAVVLSLFSIRKKVRKFFGVTFALALIDTFFLNAWSNIWSPPHMPLNMKIGMYVFVLLVFAICFVFAYKVQLDVKKPNSPLDPNDDELRAGQLKRPA